MVFTLGGGVERLTSGSTRPSEEEEEEEAAVVGWRKDTSLSPSQSNWRRNEGAVSQATGRGRPVWPQSG